MVILDPARRLSDDSPTRAGSNADSRGPVHSDAEPARAALEQQKTVVSKLPPVELHSPRGQGSGGESANALAGMQLGHFSLETLVGGGGMGSVYRATDTSLGRTVAVKVVAPDQSADETLARFKNEAQSAARLDHPNIAQVFYVGEDAGWHYIVFEFIDGVNLRDLVQQSGRLTIADTVAFTLQVAEALDHSSRRDVIHRDIKPSNVLVMKDGRAKVVDMGLARLGHVNSPSHDLTASGVTLGTFDYISPEQAADPRDTDVRSDIYSLGCTLFFMLTGSPPFPNGTVLQKLLSHSGEVPPDVREYRDDIDESLALILNKMLAKQPGDRYQQPSELIGELYVLSERLNLPLRQPSSTVWIAPQVSRWSWVERQLPWIVPVLGLLLAVVIVYWNSRLANPLVESHPRFRNPVLPVSAATQPELVSSAVREERQAVEEATVPEGARESGSTPVLRSSADVERANEPSLKGKSDRDPTTAPIPRSASAPTNSLQSVNRDQGSLRSVQAESAGLETVGGAKDQESLELSSATNRLQEGSLTDRVIVSDTEDASGVGVMVVDSIQRAFEVAAEDPGLEVIELAFNGARRVGSLELRLDRASPEELTIRAAPGYEPLLLFHSTRAEVLDTLDPAMVQVVGGKLTWQGVHFLFQLSENQADTQDSASLFSLDRVDSLVLNFCTLTIENSLRSGVSRHQNVAFFAVAPDRPLSPQPPAGAQSEVAHRIRLTDCMVRGEATLVRTEEGAPYHLDWENGLLVTSERLFWSHGASRRAAGRHRIQIELRQVTALMDRGLGQIELVSEGPYLPELELNCDRCILTTGKDDEANVPLVEYLGIRRIEDAEQRFRVIGQGNQYSRIETRWSIVPVEAERIDFPLRPIEQEWYQESNATQGIDWLRKSRVGLAHHRRSPQEYQVKAPEGGRSAAGRAGFNLEALPSFPPDVVKPGVGEDAPVASDPGAPRP